MCFHNSMSKKAQELAARYGKKSDIIEIVKDIIEENYHVNAFVFPNCPVITSNEQIQTYLWGLIPFWTRSETDALEIRKMTPNAKAETIFDKPSFREPIKSKRCVIPSTGFFEWRTEGTKKTPYYIQVKNEEIFSLAGIYDEWTNRETGEILYTFSIITTAANPLMEFIHNTKKRMPVILSKENESEWLNPRLSKSEIEKLLTPYPEHDMTAYIVANDFLKKNPHDPSIIEKVA